MQTEMLLTISVRAAWMGGWKAELQRRSEPEHSAVYVLRAEREGWSHTAAESAIPESTVQTIMDALRAARIPAAVEPSIGVDGRTTTLEWGTGWGGARYTWWGDPNGGWAPLQAIVDRITALSPIPLPEGGP